MAEHSKITRSNNSCIQVRDVSYQYPRTGEPALSSISLEIPAGGCFGLLGSNGAGKTTLISLMTGVLQLQQGEITFSPTNANTSNSTPNHATKQTAPAFSLVPQEYAFYETLTVAQNLDFFARLHKLTHSERLTRINDSCRSCGLDALQHKKAGQLSGGQKRRLNLAIGLLNKPDILFLDEPTVGIDAHSRRSLLGTIQQLGSTGITVVYTSHYFEEVEQLCNGVAIIHQGKVFVSGSTEQLLNSNSGINSIEQLYFSTVDNNQASSCNC